MAKLMAERDILKKPPKIHLSRKPAMRAATLSGVELPRPDTESFV
jgi:hypothetical protein